MAKKQISIKEFEELKAKCEVLEKAIKIINLDAYKYANKK